MWKCYVNILWQLMKCIILFDLLDYGYVVYIYLLLAKLNDTSICYINFKKVDKILQNGNFIIYKASYEATN